MRIKSALQAVAVLPTVFGSIGIGMAHADPQVDWSALSRDMKSYGIVATPNSTAQVTLVDFCDWLESSPGYFGSSNGGPSDTDVANSIKERIVNPTPGQVHALGALATAYFCPDQRGKLGGYLSSSSNPMLRAAADAGTWQKVANNGNINDWRLFI